MTLFALLHGGMHRGSCWDAVSAELHRGGHAAIAPDLPVEDDAAGAHEWAQGVVDAIDTAVGAVDTDVVVVGHSLSGLCLPSIATVHPPHGVRGWATARAGSILRRTPRHRTGGDHLSFARTRWYRADGFDVGVGARRLLP